MFMPNANDIGGRRDLRSPTNTSRKARSPAWAGTLAQPGSGHAVDGRCIFVQGNATPARPSRRLGLTSNVLQRDEVPVD